MVCPRRQRNERQHKKKETRGEALVQAVEHQSGAIQGQEYYQGNKESEIETGRKLMKESGLLGEKVTLDALHCNPTTLEMLAEEGKYVVGLKENQKELKRVLSEEIARSEPIYRTRQESEKQSGRLETRQYEVYAAEKVEKAKRWKKSDIKIAIKVERERIALGTGKRSVETSLYLSNESEKLPEVCHAIRKHWQVEVTNNLRDTTLSEDKLCVKETTVNRVMAGVRTLALGLLRLTNCANKKAQLDKFADNFGYLVCWLKSIHFL